MLVTCSALDLASPMVKTESKLIAEVLSPGTAAYDRGLKFSHYRRIASLAKYVVIDLDTRSTDCYRKGADGVGAAPVRARRDGVAGQCGAGVERGAVVRGGAGNLIAILLIAVCARAASARGFFDAQTRLLRSQSANAAHSQRSIVPVRQHR